MKSVSPQIQENIKNFILEKLPYDRSNVDVSDHLKSRNALDLLRIFVSWKRRLISRHPRNVLKSAEFEALSREINRPAEIAKLVSEIRRGDDLTPRLSRGVKTGFSLPTSPTKKLGPRHRPDLDLLLNDWRVHHLHISNEIDTDGFVKRGNKLVFAIFNYYTVYLIGIFDHKSWASKNIVEIALKNWPDRRLFIELLGLLPGSDCTDDQRHQLRNSGCPTPIDIGNRVFFGTGKLTTAGTNWDYNRLASEIWQQIAWFEVQLNINYDFIANHWNTVGLKIPNKPRFSFAFFEHAYGFYEIESDFFLKLGEI
ncbi:MAG: hypothetical protein ACPGOV_17490 [Magnetovibrionaceae bacterium]